ncbi:hypothetical protein JTB14_032060 [Gonioctena quinquepunctata]|nr:hypothetical protein JTB14_032060 [Gonioctena quinquepunctata]
MNETINEGDFLFLKLSGKKRAGYYAAKVVRKNTELNVIYLRKVAGTNKFLLDSDNMYIVEESDIILKLPAPMNTGGSAQQQSYLRFPVDLSSYNVN